MAAAKMHMDCKVDAKGCAGSSASNKPMERGLWIQGPHLESVVHTE